MITARHLLLFVRLTRPHFLLGGVLLYGLGGAIARYLGRPLDAGLYLLGQGSVTSLQLMALVLNEYFNHPSAAEDGGRTLFSGGSGALGEQALPRRTALYAAIVALTFAATLASALLFSGQASPLAWTMVLLGFLGAFLYSVPPIRLAGTGYGELITSVIVGGLVPAFAFALQTGELHRLTLMSTAPLISLHLAMMIIFSLAHYASDLRLQRRNLTVRIGWSAAMRVHDAAILFAVASLAFAYFNGMPGRVVMGAVIALPLALAQIWQIYRIRRGFPPRWPTLMFGAAGLFTLTAYLELVGFFLS